MRARVSAKVESSCQASQSARLAHVPITVRLLCPSSGMSNCPPIHPGLSWAAERRSRIAASQSGSQPVFSLTCVTTVIMSTSYPISAAATQIRRQRGFPPRLHVGLAPGVSLPCHGMRFRTASFTKGFGSRGDCADRPGRGPVPAAADFVGWETVIERSDLGGCGGVAPVQSHGCHLGRTSTGGGGRAVADVDA